MTETFIEASPSPNHHQDSEKDLSICWFEVGAYGRYAPSKRLELALRQILPRRGIRRFCELKLRWPKRSTWLESSRANEAIRIYVPTDWRVRIYRNAFAFFDRAYSTHCPVHVGAEVVRAAQQPA